MNVASAPTLKTKSTSTKKTSDFVDDLIKDAISSGVRHHHVGNPGDVSQILDCFRSYAAQFDNRKVPITPDWARLLLKLNRDLPEDDPRDQKTNRPLKAAKIERFKNDLRNGTFYFTNIGIGFDEDGWLADGQSRLTACVETGIPIEVNVTFDMHRDAFSVIDSAMSARSMTDLAYMTGFRKNTGSSVAVATVLYRHAMGIGDRIRLNPEEILEALKMFPDVEPSVGRAKAMKAVPGSRKVIAAVHYLAAKVNRDVADKVFEDLATGAVADTKDPVVVVRNRLLMAYRSPVANEFKGDGNRRLRILLSRMFNYRLHNLKASKLLISDGDDDWPGDPVNRSTRRGLTD